MSVNSHMVPEPVAFQCPAGRLSGMAAGPAGGRTVLLLHGFPEFWYGWRKQIPALAGAGLRVVAIDQRGYNTSAKPANVRDYELAELRSDVLAVADQLGCDRISLAGHDWGGIVAWSVAMHHPGRVDRLAILNAPYPAAARAFLSRSLRQMIRSWYVLFFQLPTVPEQLLTARNFDAMKTSLRASSRAGTFSPEELEQYRKAWSQPGAVRAMVNWYRALVRFSRRNTDHIRVQCPVRIFWGMHDRFLLPELARLSLDYCDDAELIEFTEATHWLHHEEPERVNTLLAEWFLAATPP